MDDSGAPRDAWPRAADRVIGRRRGDRIVGSSRAIQDVIEQAVAAAASDLPVRISGPVGCGKDQVARAIHGWSARASGPFVRDLVRGRARSAARPRAVRLRRVDLSESAAGVRRRSRAGRVHVWTVTSGVVATEWARRGSRSRPRHPAALARSQGGRGRPRDRARHDSARGRGRVRGGRLSGTLCRRGGWRALPPPGEAHGHRH